MGSWVAQQGGGSAHNGARTEASSHRDPCALVALRSRVGEKNIPLSLSPCPGVQSRNDARPHACGVRPPTVPGRRRRALDDRGVGRPIDRRSRSLARAPGPGTDTLLCCTCSISRWIDRSCVLIPFYGVLLMLRPSMWLCTFHPKWSYVRLVDPCGMRGTPPHTHRAVPRRIMRVDLLRSLPCSCSSSLVLHACMVVPAGTYQCSASSQRGPRTNNAASWGNTRVSVPTRPAGRVVWVVSYLLLLWDHVRYLQCLL